MKQWQHTMALVAGVAFLSLTSMGVLAEESHKNHTDVVAPAGVAPLNLTDEQLIKSAHEAGPIEVTSKATIIAIGADGSMRTLQKGSNSFTCMPDDPTTPGQDPMCADPNAWDFVLAMMARKDPPKGKVGFAYMMRGGTDASNTDPFATKPEPNNNWVETGAHVMLMGLGGDIMRGYPRDPKPDTTQPYVMYANTPYEHLMVPVGPKMPTTAAK